MIPHPGRRGGLRGPLLALVGSLAVLLALLALLFWNPSHWFAWFSGTPQPAPVVVYCAASLRNPVEKAAKQYEAECGVPVQLQFGPSQTLLASVEVARRGDLYLPADDLYLQMGRDKQLVAESLPLARQRPVLGVKVGNPRGLKTVNDLLADGVRLSLANPDTAAISHVARDRLGRQRWEALQKHAVATRLTVTEVANDVQLGTADAGFVYDTTVRQLPALEAVTLPGLEGKPSLIEAGVLTVSTQPTAALRFARYLAARDRGLPLFRDAGFEVVEGDAWAATPEIRLYAGAMLRPAIEETVAEFEAREGCRVTRVYNGCGILVAQMKTSQGSPDAYFACDRSFMNMVGQRFEAPLTLSGNELVILVPKGNPHGIRTLADLGKPGLRVGVGHEKQCALGALTQETVRQEGVHDLVMRNVKVQAPTGDLLVNELRTGALDAVIAYRSNAAAAGAELDTVRINIPCALAEQPVAVGKGSDHKYLTGRLLEALRSPRSRQRFEALNFTWKDDLSAEAAK